MGNCPYLFRQRDGSIVLILWFCIFFGIFISINGYVDSWFIGVPPVIIHFNRIFHYKPSSYWSSPILGHLHMGLSEHKHSLPPNLRIEIIKFQWTNSLMVQPIFRHTHIWLVVWTPLKNISQLGWWFPIYGKTKNVPNHQPDSDAYA